MLLPEQYRSAAQKCDKGELAVPFACTVFDLPQTVLTPEQLADTVDGYGPARSDGARRDRQTCLLAAILSRKYGAGPGAERERIEALAELQLRGGRKADLTGAIRSTGWRDAARIVTDMLAAHAHPDVPVQVRLSGHSSSIPPVQLAMSLQ